MAHISADRIQETTTTTGTGTLTLLGAVTNYKTFASRMATSDTCWYCIVDTTNNAWEVGLGTLASSSTLTRTTVIRSSNSDAVVTLAAGTKQVFMTLPGDKANILDNNGTILLPAVSNPPAAPTDTLSFFARKISGRMMPKWMPPSGLDTPLQPALFGNQVVLYTPYNSTTVTPNGFGALWAKGGSTGLVSTPTLVTTSPTFLNSMRRTRHASAVTTANQGCGIVNSSATSVQFWRGNAAGLGGFFFFARFGLGAWTAGSRIFCGLTASSTEVVISNTIQNNSIGLFRSTTDTGNTLQFVSRDGATTNTVSVTGATVAAGSCFDVYMFAKPNDSTIYYRVDQIDTGGTTLIDTSTTTNIPVNTVFMGAQVEASNGANTLVNAVQIDVNRIYVESDH